MGEGTLTYSLRLLAVSLVLRLASLWIGSSAVGREPYYSDVAPVCEYGASAVYFLRKGGSSA